MFAIFKWLLLITFTLLLAGFSAMNRHLVTIQFYPLPFELELPVYLLILLLFFAGFTTAWLLDRLHSFRLSRRVHRAHKRNDALEEEVARLRHSPAAHDSH